MSKTDQVAHLNNMKRQGYRREVSLLADLIDTPHDFGDIENDGSEFPLTLPANGHLAFSCSTPLSAGDVTVNVGPNREFTCPALAAGEVFNGEYGEKQQRVDVSARVGSRNLSMYFVDGFKQAHQIGGGALAGRLYAPPTIEGFERISGNIPVDGPIAWVGDTTDQYVLERSILHTSEGDYSAKYTSVQGGIFTSPPFDFTGLTTIELDVFVESNSPGLQAFMLSVYGPPTVDRYQHTTEGGTGAFTLSVNVSGIVTTPVIQLGGWSSGDMVAYIDDLRLL